MYLRIHCKFFHVPVRTLQLAKMVTKVMMIIFLAQGKVSWQEFEIGIEPDGVFILLVLLILFLFLSQIR